MTPTIQATVLAPTPVHAPVLVVDDIATMRDILVRQLKSLGYTQVFTAASGTEALRLLEHRPVQLILSDWSMPGMSGLDLLQEVRKQERLRRIPFIMVTAELQRERVAQAIQAGVHDFLLKPFKPVEFGRKVGEALFGKPKNTQLLGSGDAAHANEAKARARATVLIVDDVPDNLTLASGLLREHYITKLATRGDKALQLCQTTPPDLVLLDIMMPEMDGFEVCRRLKADPATAYIPVIFLTALDDVQKTVQGLGLGAVDYVTKPMEPEILKARVATALRIAQAQEDLRAQYDLAIQHARLQEEVERITRHDLKNPLAAIIGMATNLLTHGSLDADAGQQIKAIEQAAYAMLDLIDLSNDLMKIELGQYQLTPQTVDLRSLLERVVGECRSAFAAKNVHFQFDGATAGDSAWVQGEALLLYSMLHNLVKNAAEAVHAGETVALELVVGARCQVRVSNPGQVAPEIAARFFEKYASHGKPHGTGLGTFSARLIAQAHGGSIAMASDNGTVVLTVDLPRHPSLS